MLMLKQVLHPDDAEDFTTSLGDALAEVVGPFLQKALSQGVEQHSKGLSLLPPQETTDHGRLTLPRDPPRRGSTQTKAYRDNSTATQAPPPQSIVTNSGRADLNKN
jgi:hypothetical protein